MKCDNIDIFVLSDEVDDDKVEDDVGEDEVGESSFRTDPAEVVLVRWVHLEKDMTRNQLKIAYGKGSLTFKIFRKFMTL